MVLFQAGKEFDMLELDMPGPCVLVYHDEEGICDAFLLCEKRVGCHAPLRNAFHVITLLIGAYFVMERSYPSPYEKFLHFLHCEVLGFTNPRFNQSIAYNRFFNVYSKV